MRFPRTLAALATTAVLVACSGPSSQPTTGPRAVPSSPAASASPVPTASGEPSPSQLPSPTRSAEEPLAGWTLEQKVGQLLMVGVSVTSPEPVSRAAIEDHHVGNVFLHGRTEAGVDAVRELVDGYRSLESKKTTQGTPLLVATDQEGGLVQVLRGPGFDDIPRATDQARWKPAKLERRAERWGSQLAAAGVNLNLAPVMDLVPKGSAAQNLPIGYFHRSYGFTARSVVASADAFSAGQRAAGVETVIKHFPGLGHVTENTDTATDVTDTVTTAGSRSVHVFAEGIDAGAQFVMLSSAAYDRIDPGVPAMFSPVVVDELLRGRLGFEGVVMTDDVSAAAQVQPWSPGERAVRSVEAGVDIVLASADPSVVPEMAEALVSRAEEDADFAAKVDAAARRVLAAKSSLTG